MLICDGAWRGQYLKVYLLPGEIYFLSWLGVGGDGFFGRWASHNLMPHFEILVYIGTNEIWLIFWIFQIFPSSLSSSLSLFVKIYVLHVILVSEAVCFIFSLLDLCFSCLIDSWKQYLPWLDGESEIAFVFLLVIPNFEVWYIARSFFFDFIIRDNWSIWLTSVPNRFFSSQSFSY